MKILMMAAGGGARFKADGFDTPKPFIPVRNRQMWEHVALQSGLVDLEASLVIRKEIKHYLHMDKWSPIKSVITIPRMLDQGPAWSVVAATLNIPEDESVLLVDCDCFVDGADGKSQIKQELARCTAKTGKEEFKPTAIAFGAKAIGNQLNAAFFSARVHEVLSGYEIVEATKENGGTPDGDVLNVGTYWFKSLKTFRETVFNVSSNTDGEVRLSDVFNNWPDHNDVHLLNGRFYNLGTPQELRAYR